MCDKANGPQTTIPVRMDIPIPACHDTGPLFNARCDFPPCGNCVKGSSQGVVDKQQKKGVNVDGFVQMAVSTEFSHNYTKLATLAIKV